MIIVAKANIEDVYAGLVMANGAVMEGIEAKLFFTFFSVALGFSLHNSIAVLEGHMGKRSEFVRTPKFNISNLTETWKGNKYLAKKLSPNMILEFALMVYFLFGMYSAIPLNDFGLFPFHFMLFVGFGFVFFKSLTARA